MRILSPPLAATMAGKLDAIRQLEADGFDGAYLPSVGHDAMTVLALAAGETSTIELGTYVIPTYTRHPVAMAQQALATNAAAGGRFTLGLGLSHEVVIRDSWGLDFSKVVRHMREYLEVLQPLMRGEQVDFEGEEFRVHSKLELPDCEPPSVIVAALGPQMLRVTGRLADGTALWLAGPKWIEEVVIPEMGDAAAGRGQAGTTDHRRRADLDHLRSRWGTRADRPRLRDVQHAALVPTRDPGVGSRRPRGRLDRGQRGGGRAGAAALARCRRDRLLRRLRGREYAEERQRTREFVAALAPNL